MMLANMGLPMIFVVWPTSFFLIVPVILVEWFLACRLLKIPAREGFYVSGFGNVVSTILAVPVTWGAMLILALLTPYSSMDTFAGVLNNVVVHSAWLGPWEGKGDWMVPAAALTLCIPFFFASVRIEYSMAKWILRNRFPQARCGRWAWTANSVTYGAIAICLLALLVTGLTT